MTAQNRQKSNAKKKIVFQKKQPTFEHHYLSIIHSYLKPNYVYMIINLKWVAYLVSFIWNDSLMGMKMNLVYFDGQMCMR